jgi:hypothetical protein
MSMKLPFCLGYSATLPSPFARPDRTDWEG